MSIRCVSRSTWYGTKSVVLAREVDRRAVGQVAALVEAEAEHRVARLQERVVDGHVRLRAGVRLHVDVLGAEELLRAIARQVLGNVDDLAAAVVAPARVALGVLAGEDAAHRLEHREARVVLGGDQLQVGARALLLVAHDLRDLGILVSSGAQRSMRAVYRSRSRHDARVG